MNSTLRYAIPLIIAVCLLSAHAEEDNQPDPDNIYNFHQVNHKLATSGQVFPVQVPKLQSEKFSLVVNLAVADEERNGQESFHVTNAGISYVQIPVIWDTPTQQDLLLFFAVMDARADRKTLVHCFANYRASAFTYLYRIIREGVPEEEAREDLYAIWDDAAFEEYPQWRSFIDDTLANADY